ncbi:hypothetical protein BUE80_DR008361, partial [Diplocarpon rosae]
PLAAVTPSVVASVVAAALASDSAPQSVPAGALKRTRADDDDDDNAAAEEPQAKRQSKGGVSSPLSTRKRVRLLIPGDDELTGEEREVKRRSEAGIFGESNTLPTPHDDPCAGYASPSASTPTHTDTPTRAAITALSPPERRRSSITPHTRHYDSLATLDGSSSTPHPTPTPTTASITATSTTYIRSDSADGELAPGERRSPTPLPRDDSPAGLGARDASASSSTPTATPTPATASTPAPGASPSTPVPPASNTAAVVGASTPPGKYFDQIVPIPSSPVVRSWEIPEATIEAEEAGDDREDGNLHDSDGTLDRPATPVAYPQPEPPPLPFGTVVEQAARRVSLPPPFTPEQPVLQLRPATFRDIIGDVARRLTPRFPFGFSRKAAAAVVEQPPSPTRAERSNASNVMTVHSPAAVERPPPTRGDRSNASGLMALPSSAVMEQPSPTRAGGQVAARLAAGNPTAAMEQRPAPPEADWRHLYKFSPPGLQQQPSPTKFDRSKAWDLKARHFGTAKNTKGLLMTSPYFKRSEFSHLSDDEDDMDADEREACKVQFRKEIQLRRERLKLAKEKKSPDTRKRSAAARAKAKEDQNRKKLDPIPAASHMVAAADDAVAEDTSGPSASAPPPNPVVAQAKGNTDRDPNLHTSRPTTRATASVEGVAAGGTMASTPSAPPPELPKIANPLHIRQIKGTPAADHCAAVAYAQKTMGELLATYPGIIPQEKTWGQRVGDLNDEEFELFNKMGRPTGEFRYTMFEYHLQKIREDRLQKTRGILRSRREEAAACDELFHKKAEKPEMVEEATKGEERKKAAKEARRAAREATRAKKASEPKKEVFRPPPGTYGLFYEGWPEDDGYSDSWPEDDGYSDSDDSSSEDSGEEAEEVKERSRIEERARAEEERVRMNKERDRAEEERVRINKERARAEEERVRVAPPSPRKRGDVSPIKPSRLRIVQNMSPIVMSPLQAFSLNSIQPRYRRISEAYPECIENQKLGFVDSEVAVARIAPIVL